MSFGQLKPNESRAIESKPNQNSSHFSEKRMELPILFIFIYSKSRKLNRYILTYF